MLKKLVKENKDRAVEKNGACRCKDADASSGSRLCGGWNSRKGNC